METLLTYIRWRADHAVRYVLAEIENMTDVEAAADRRADWPGQDWGVGQDGSVAGIIYHLAAWKQVSLGALEAGGGECVPMQQLSADTYPPVSDWEGVRGWYRTVSGLWNDALNRLPEEALPHTILLEGEKLPLLKFAAIMADHDIQHAGQIEYLNQRRSI